MIKKTIFIQFRFPQKEILKHLPKNIEDKIKRIIKDDNMFSSLLLENNDPLYEKLLNNNIIINNKSLIRLIREKIDINNEDIDENKFYELFFETDEIKLISDPINYYDVKTDCIYCGRYSWNQKKNLEIKKDINKNLRITNNNELLISRKFQDLLIKNNIENIDFKKTNKDNTIQLILKEKTIIKQNQFLIKENYCTNCNNPRIVKYENTNNVSLFSIPLIHPRIEKIPIIELKKKIKDISYTKNEFGTLGRLPEGAPLNNDPYEYTFKTSEAKIIISGKFAKLLFQIEKKGFQLIPCE